MCSLTARAPRPDLHADEDADADADADANANANATAQSQTGSAVLPNDRDRDRHTANASTNANINANANAKANANTNTKPNLNAAAAANATTTNGPSGDLTPSASDSEDHEAGNGYGSSSRGLHPTGVDDEAEADDVIGVSMGYDQSRLKSRSTPAEEKTRIMERNGGSFEDEGLFSSVITEEPEALTLVEDKDKGMDKDKVQDKDEGSREKVSREPQGARTSFTRSLLKSTLPLRPRAWSGDSHTSRLKKFFPSFHLRTGSLSMSVSRHRSPSWSSRLNLDQEGTVSGSAASRSPQLSSVTNSNSNSNPGSPASDYTAPAEDPIGELRPLQAPSAQKRAKHSFVGSNPTLRRSSSDQSLYLRASSTASSLEHRPQYEHIHQQTNSRFKAIKDTLQDSSSRLLSMPTLHLQDLRSDWGYRQFLSDAHNRRTENTTDETVASADSPLEADDQPSSALPRSATKSSARKSVAATYPVLFEAMSELTGDVVVMGGYRGSILRSAKPPQRQLWVPMKVGLNLRKVDLEVGLTHEDEERMEETIIPDGVLSHVGPVDICRRLLKRLQKCDNAIRGDLRAHNYGYDWRLSPHLLSKRLIKYLEGLPCNAPDVPPHKRGAYVIAHSLGGLIARHAVNQRPELFAGVVYAGVPQHCVNILGPLRNGDDVLLSSRVLTAQVNFTFRTSFALLPEKGHCFINKRTKEEYRLDFFDPAVWDEFRLSPCINPPLPVPPSSRSASNLPLRKRFSTILSNSSTDDSIGLGTSFDSSSTDHSPIAPISASGSATSTPALGATGAKDAAAEAAHSAKNTLKLNKNDVLPGPGPATNPKSSSSTYPAVQPVTIPRAAARQYLARTLKEVADFKHETLHNIEHQSGNKYPPFAVLYSKSVPTVYGARVSSREAIKNADAYDDLAFAAGDGVCLASAAMLPAGYRVIKEGLVKSERGHVGLLGDLEGVGACLRAVVRGRREGVGIEGSASP
ncbi:uncharacterized protein BDV17DRAFT_286850 [Aspergillus undulatus]|uniref:uncharacterized protein n=1 Tax=Aspergillus undulatus TaxID=1810928 RepID=UPI003CCE2220